MKAFFNSTRDAASEITDLCDFSWAIMPALWNLRWQVNGYLIEVPNASEQQLIGRFVSGSNIVGANLRKSCVSTSWKEQQALFSGILLTNAFAIYEYWADQILIELAIPKEAAKVAGLPKSFEKDDMSGVGRILQVPDDIEKKRLGISGIVAKITDPPSRMLSVTYYPIYSNDRKYSWASIEALIYCYRYFKELRNCQIHNGGIADTKAAAASEAFVKKYSKKNLGLKSELDFIPVKSGDSVTLTLRGVVGFLDILLRMMISVDAELCRSSFAETYFEKRLQSSVPSLSVLATKIERRRIQVGKFCLDAGFPRPATFEPVYKFMKIKRMIQV